MRASGKSIQPFDPVGKPMFYQKVQRTVGNGRLRTKTIIGQSLKDIIGAKGPVFLKKDFQRSAPHRSFPQAGRRRTGFCRCKDLARTL